MVEAVDTVDTVGSRRTGGGCRLGRVQECFGVVKVG